jgi:beta-galactosidase
LRGLLGVRVEEFHPLAPDDRVKLASADGLNCSGDLWSETVQPAGARVVACYGGGVLDGLPAVTRHTVGAGEAYYISTRLDLDGYGALLAGVAASAGVRAEQPGLPPGVEAVRRHGDDRSWLFLLNHTGEAHEVPAGGLDLLTGTTASGVVRLPAGGAAVLREPDRDGVIVNAPNIDVSRSRGGPHGPS